MGAALNTILPVTLLLLPTGVIFTAVTGLLHPAAITLFLLLISGCRRRPLAVTDRSIIYAITAALMLMGFGDFLFPLKANAFGFFGMLFRPEWLVPLTFFAAAVSTLFRNRELSVALALIAEVLTLAFLGDLQPPSANSNQSALRLLTTRFEIFYPGLLLLSLAVTLPILSAPGRASLRKWLLLSAAIVLVPVVAAGGFMLFRHYREELRTLENYLLRAGMRRRADDLPGGTVFPDQRVNLNRTLTSNLRKHESQIMLQVVAAQAPGYLRGQAFRTYRRGNWFQSEAENAPLPVLDAEGVVSERIFFFEQAARGPERYDIYPSSRLHTNLLYYPSGAGQLSLLAEQLDTSVDGTLRASGLVASGGYRAFVSSRQERPFPRPADPTGDAELREVPEELQPTLREILVACGIDRDTRDLAVFRKLLSFFGANFRYSLDMRETAEDPILHFLNQSRRGHCELYATALALLLRQQGIPSRYVTGYLCNEPHLSGRSFIARLGNAHAWVEAFDRDRQHWVTLEPTPASPDVPARRFEEVRQYGEWAGLIFRQLLADLRRGLFAQALLQILELVWRLLLALLYTPLPWLLLAALGWWGVRSFRRLRREQLRSGPDARRRKLAAGYLREVRRLRRRGVLPRRGAPPTAARLRTIIAASTLSEPEKNDWDRRLLAYQRQRYRATPDAEPLSR